MTLAEANADAHGPRPDLRDGRGRHPRRPDPHLEERAARPCAACSTCPPPTATPPSSSTRTSGSSFAEHHRMASTLAHRLRDTFGVEKGDRVAIVMRNIPEWIIAFWGATLAGADRRAAERMVERRGAALRPRGLRLQGGLRRHRAGRAHPLLPRRARHPQGHRGRRRAPDRDRRRPLAVYEPPGGAPPIPEWPFALALGTVDEAATPPDVAIDPEDDATIFYTSGTTGRPKGAVGTHRNMITNLMSLFFLNTADLRALRHLVAARRGPRSPPSGSSPPSCSRCRCSTPPGCHSIMMTNTAAGGKIVIMHHFDPERALQLIEREKIGTFGGVPAMVMQVLDSPNFAKYDTSSIRGVSYGGAPGPARPGAPHPRGLADRLALQRLRADRDLVGHLDERRRRLRGQARQRRPAGAGLRRRHRPRGLRSRTSPTTTIPRGPDVRGELWIKGPNVVRGYWNRPDETAKTFSKGWLHTGDVAQLDDENFIYIVDRAKDMIIRGGENVYSVQVEAALFEHPAVADVAVIGVPHHDAGRGGRRRRRAPSRGPRSRPTSSACTSRPGSPASWCRRTCGSAPSRCPATRRARSSSASYAKRSWRRATEPLAGRRRAAADSPARVRAP